MAHNCRSAWGMVVALSIAGCFASQGFDDLDGIGRAVASDLDSRNGFPTAVLDEYLCDSRVETCREREDHWDASLVDASVLVTAFAEVRGIPVEHYSGYGPRCEWVEASDTRTVGLWADFLQPVILGDSARVELMTGCVADQKAFSQTHEFVLKKDGEGVWAVVSRQRLIIT